MQHVTTDTASLKRRAGELAENTRQWRKLFRRWDRPAGCAWPSPVGQRRRGGLGSHTKAQAECQLYLDPPAGTVLFSVDEKIAMHARSRKRATRLVRPGQVEPTLTLPRSAVVYAITSVILGQSWSCWAMACSPGRRGLL
ncbi:MAG: hypothetical protein ACRDRX_18040 [Pseudonocardiaceae bacterium]